MFMSCVCMCVCLGWVLGVWVLGCALNYVYERICDLCFSDVAYFVYFVITFHQFSKILCIFF